MNVLILPGTNLCAREIANSLATMKDVCLFGAGSDLSASSTFPYERFYYIPDISQRESALASLSELVRQNQFDLIIPAHDQWIYDLRDTESISNTPVLKHCSRAIGISSFKSKTYEYFYGHIPVPRVYSLGEDIIFPVFGKPDRGQGSRGSQKISNREELDAFAASNPENFILCDFLPGAEFTIDCFSAEDSKVLYSSPRERLSILHGLAIESKTISEPSLHQFAEIISIQLQLSGAWFFQIKLDHEAKPVLMEIGLRLAGASGLQRGLGVNLSAAWVYQFFGNKINILKPNCGAEVRVVNQQKVLSYSNTFDEIYVDLDDTLILNELFLNENLKCSLFETKKLGIRLTLITRHKKNLSESLSQHGIEELFDHIIWIADSATKSSHIECEGNFIFIDDSYIERLDVKTKFRERVLCLDQASFEGFNVSFEPFQEN